MKKSPATKTPVSLQQQLKDIAHKTTTIEVDGIDGPIHFRGLSTYVALTLRDFDPEAPSAEKKMIGVISDLAYDAEGNKLFDEEVRFVDLPVELTGQIMDKFGKLMASQTPVPLAPSKTTSTG